MDANNLKQQLEKFKLPIALSFLGLVLILGGLFASSLKPKPKDLPAGRQGFPKESLITGTKQISVDVSGAVKKPGVYKLNDGDRIEKAIEASGGFLENVNKEYVSKYLNLAQKLSDGSKLYVPFEGEGAGSVTSQAGAVAGVQSKLNINTASQTDLESLPGIGPVTASKIISSRSYQVVEELLSKKAVSKAVFEKIKDLVVVY